MTLQEIDRIECAIRHIESSLDVDPWVEALKTQEQLANNSPELANNFGDLISRKAAIDAVRSNYEGILDFTSDGHTIADSVEDILSDLPSAQPERKKGKWNFIGDNMFECTYCGVAYTTQQLNGLRNYNVDPYAPKFCPNCGADMRGEQDETD